MKKISSLLQEKPRDLEKHCWANGQYSKREFVSRAGLPAGMNLTNLWAKIIRTFSNIFLVNEIKTFLSNFSGLMTLFEKQNPQMLVIEEVLKYLKMQKFLWITVCAHSAKCYGLKVRSYSRLEKFTNFFYFQQFNRNKAT